MGWKNPPNCYYKQTEQIGLSLCSPSKKQGFPKIWREERTLRHISSWGAMLKPLSTVYYESYRCHLGEGGRCSTVVNKILFPGVPGTPLGLCICLRSSNFILFQSCFGYCRFFSFLSGCQFLQRALLVFSFGLFWTYTLSRGEGTS